VPLGQGGPRHRPSIRIGLAQFSGRGCPQSERESRFSDQTARSDETSPVLRACDGSAGLKRPAIREIDLCPFYFAAGPLLWIEPSLGPVWNHRLAGVRRRRASRFNLSKHEWRDLGVESLGSEVHSITSGQSRFHPPLNLACLGGRGAITKQTAALPACGTSRPCFLILYRRASLPIRRACEASDWLPFDCASEYRQKDSHRKDRREL
jgi:hypothetical protein